MRCLELPALSHISALLSVVLLFMVAFVVGVRSKPWVCCLGPAFLVPLAASSWRRYCCGFYVPWSPSWPGGRSNPAQFFVGVPQFIASQLWLVGASPSVSVPSLLGITAKGGVPCLQNLRCSCPAMLGITAKGLSVGCWCLLVSLGPLAFGSHSLVSLVVGCILCWCA